MSVKPYFRPKNTYNVKPDKLEVTTKPDKPEATAELNKLEAPLPTLEVPQKPNEPMEPAVKRGRGRPRKNPVMENHLTSAGTSAKQSPPADILVLV